MKKQTTVVFTNGCFDVLHEGHLRLLAWAKGFGGKLIVGLNSDKSVRRLKGPDRPVNNQNARRSQLLALPFVDDVIIFNESTPVRLISQLKPDIHIKGSDWQHKPLPERPIIESYGGRIVFFPLIPDVSTSRIIKKIQRSGKKKRRIP